MSLVASSELQGETRVALIDLINRAYEEDLTALFDNLGEGVHLLGTVGGQLVTHAMWVTRWLQVARGPLLRTAYVELVATDAAYRNRGYAAAVMRRLQREICDCDIAALSPFSVAYYARLGWEPWQGPLFIRKDGALVATPEDEEVMILRLPKTPGLDLTQPLSIEWREGEVW
ncbi:MAG: GNAT family N-acetyltransferase [Anaerolineae bacterium]|nr:GNAT family N-acetyltransferase [Anaerolineae bacterium]